MYRRPFIAVHLITAQESDVHLITAQEAGVHLIIAQESNMIISRAGLALDDKAFPSMSTATTNSDAANYRTGVRSQVR